MPRTNTIRLRAQQVVDRLEAEQIRRLAEMPADHIPVAVGPESADRFDREAVEELREEISRLCRDRTTTAA